MSVIGYSWFSHHFRRGCFQFVPGISWSHIFPGKPRNRFVRSYSSEGEPHGEINPRVLEFIFTLRADYCLLVDSHCSQKMFGTFIVRRSINYVIHKGALFMFTGSTNELCIPHMSVLGTLPSSHSFTEGKRGRKGREQPHTLKMVF